MPKSPDAFRTISEVADWLGVQAHVLRFWESKFSQVKPTKRAGGRRYYRPSDMLLLGGIKKLLHDDGLTIKGAQKLLREKGVSFVADMSQPLDDLTMAVIESNAGRAEEMSAEDMATLQDMDRAEGASADRLAPVPSQTVPANPEPQQEAPVPADPAPVLDLSEEPAPAKADEKKPPARHAEAAPPSQTEPELAEPGEQPEPTQVEFDLAPENVVQPVAEDAPPEVHSQDPDLSDIAAATPPLEDTGQIPDHIEPDEDAPSFIPLPDDTSTSGSSDLDAQTQDKADAPEDGAENEQPLPPTSAVMEETSVAEPAAATAPLADDEETPAVMPSFRARARQAPPPQGPAAGPETGTEPARIATPSELEAVSPSPDAAPLGPLGADIPDLPPRAEIVVKPSLLSRIARLKSLTPEQAREIKPHLARLARLRDSMAARRED